MEKILAVNAGSSSLKFQLLLMPLEKVITEGLIEKIGSEQAIYTIKYEGEKHKKILPVCDHAKAVSILLEDIIKRNIVSSLEEIKGIGHRIVQGGWYFQDSALIDEDVLNKIEELSTLAPLHNPAHIVGIKAFQAVLPNTKAVAVFDTSFHQTMKQDTFMYATPYEWYTKHKIRKYGAHGTSHKYVSMLCAEVMGKKSEDLKIITCHLGNGASIAAVKGGVCIDTSMGLTPLEGIPMGTRSGNIDPAVIEFISEKENLGIQEILSILNHKSGYLGVSGVSNDSREIEDGALAGNERCNLALEIQFKRIADYIGSYYVSMSGLDALVFTAGIGENSSYAREKICERLSVLGVELDEEANKSRGEVKLISKPESKVKVYIIPTNEELMIARDVIRLTK
ncbi:MAG: acetate kinase [Bacilli bacterium]|jgi:acetate kinase|nr:acetate kinase [Bacilli bacterium]MDD2681581.1 acetate kinase [Bacilli bacterium]MDD3121533.1 acetate kinase [Bacilli bacterium]MDD4482241.1 acetate kinase [Bacilli bacterium]MDD5182848.1 acetate kinase [Bacilli bacterium]